MSLDRREFLTALVVSGAVAAAPAVEIGADPQAAPTRTEEWNSKIDFRFAPRNAQSTICFPDDPHKTVVGPAGDLRYGFAKALAVGMNDFATVVGFSLAGFDDDHVARQWVEKPGVPIVHTLVERPAATFELIAFASRHASEGRVDNVLIEVKSKRGTVAVEPVLRLRTCDKLERADYSDPYIAVRVSNGGPTLLTAVKVGSPSAAGEMWEEQGYSLFLPHGEATETQAARYFIRLPREAQSVATFKAGLQDPDALLAETRDFWAQWKPFGSTEWSYPERHGEFLGACARNIQQAREVKNGRLVFQVGPTVYRGLWIVDGNFLLEAARYLGYDHEADEGLQSEWNKQLPSGQVVAGGGGEHWKDTAIAMFTLVRQCELKQDWSLFHQLEPNVSKAIDFLVGLRDQARAGNSTNGRYGLLAPGFADGGIAGLRSEFTNSVWALAGLKAVADAAEREQMPALAKAGTFFKELYAAFEAMSKQEMVRHPGGFDYLPMLAHDDALLRDPDPWNRPRPQSAQWALSHAIYPGTAFAKDDLIVKGHIALMQWCTKEDVPAETGWLWHDAIWNYNASFVAHVYLWAGLRDWAHRTFTGFLNHASPLYCWREEQPLQHALVGQDWGDMPHNWASAECVRYLRHMLALEDGNALRLLEGMTATELTRHSHYSLVNSPTRFGRIGLEIEPAGVKAWRVAFKRGQGPAPVAVRIPRSLGLVNLSHVVGADAKVQEGIVEIDPTAGHWEAFFS